MAKKVVACVGELKTNKAESEAESEAETLRVSVKELADQLKELNAENKRLGEQLEKKAEPKDEDAEEKAGSSKAAPTTKKKEASMNVTEYMEQFSRGTRPKLLKTLEIKALNGKSITQKINSFKLSGDQKKTMSSLVTELCARLDKNLPEPELEKMHDELTGLTIEWGLKPALATDPSDYKVLAKLLALCVVLDK